MAQTPLKDQPWKCGAAQVQLLRGTGGTNTSVAAIIATRDLDLRSARIVWETAGQEPSFGSTLSFTPAGLATTWLEAEAQLPDGRRLFASTNFPLVR